MEFSLRNKIFLKTYFTTFKLLGQGYVKERLISSLKKFYGRYLNLTKQYEVPLYRMFHDIPDDDHVQWHPPLIGYYTNFWPLLIWIFLPNLTFYLTMRDFNRTFATDATCQQRTLTLPDTWSCPTFGHACVLLSKPIAPKLVLFPDFWVSNILWYFSFALDKSFDYDLINFPNVFQSLQVKSVTLWQKCWCNLKFLRREILNTRTTSSESN